MQFPESWLREFCNPPLTTQELAETLTMAGLEVEELAPVAPPFSKIVVGEINQPGLCNEAAELDQLSGPFASFDLPVAHVGACLDCLKPVPRCCQLGERGPARAQFL